jgi:hypothetical protein
MRYILICEIPFPSPRPPGRCLHTRALTRDQVIAAIKRRWNNIEETLALLDACSSQEGAGRRHYGVPVEMPAGRHTLHVEGKMDYELARFRWPCPKCQAQGKGCQHRLPLEWVSPDHTCSPRCYIVAPARSMTHVAVK